MAAANPTAGNRSPAPSAKPEDAPAPSSSSAASVAEFVNRFRWIILIGLMFSSIMEVLDTTIINVALPQMAGNLSATSTEIAWVSTAYILANVIILPMTAFLSQTFGRKRYLLFSIVLFIVASFFCGTSGTLGEIIFWRILQGAGGAALLSTAQATLRQIFPPNLQGIVQALFLLGIIVAPTLGPTLGGWITDNYTWSWTFFINVPIGLISLFLIGSFLKDAPQPKRGPVTVDWLGIGLLAVGLGSLQYVLEEGNQDDWFQSQAILLLTILSVICLTAMLAWELWPGNKNPVVNFRILNNRDLAASLILFTTLGFGLYGGIFLFPLFSQNVLRFTPTETGLVLLPGGLATIVGVLVCGRVLNGPKAKADPRVLIFFGMIMFMISMWYLGHLTTASGEPDTRFALILRGLGLGFLFTPINLVAFSSLKPNEVQQASGLINLVRQLGGSFGIAVLGTYVTNQQVFHRSIIGEHLYPGNPLLLERQRALEQLLVSRGYSPAQAAQGWIGILSQQVGRQAATQAYNDAFLLILIIFVVAAPAVLLLRKRKSGGGAPAGDAH